MRTINDLTQFQHRAILFSTGLHPVLSLQIDICKQSGSSPQKKVTNAHSVLRVLVTMKVNPLQHADAILTSRLQTALKSLTILKANRVQLQRPGGSTESRNAAVARLLPAFILIHSCHAFSDSPWIFFSCSTMNLASRWQENGWDKKVKPAPISSLSPPAVSWISL